jgi:hypothetical protein
MGMIYSHFPTTVEEAIRRLRQQLPAAELARIATLPEDDLIWLHFGLGTAIRNDFGLWAPDSPILRATGKDHADDAAAFIVRTLWRELRNGGGAVAPSDDVEEKQ